MNEEQKQRYRDAVHAMQAGVSAIMACGSSEADPKHLRVGVNNALVEGGVLTKLLIDKGAFTEEEYFEALLEGVEAEVAKYKEKLKEFGINAELV